jgi:4-hydroxythreonine-4-phosphate dehydrogenase
MGDTQPLPPIAVTMGEPAGVGGEIALKAWQQCDATLPGFFLLDDPRRVAGLAARTGLDVPVQPIANAADAPAVFPQALPVLPLDQAVAVEPGRPTPETAAAVIAAIERAVALAQAGEAVAVVTNPIHKHVLYDAGFGFPGHTEFLASLAGGDPHPVMLLAGPALRVVPVSVHLSLRQAIASLDGAAILRCARIAAQAMTQDFGIARPRLAVAGLNPHAGEAGALGDEEERIIAPAVAQLRRDGIAVAGPLPPDSMFHADARRSYDVAICMYHDQALIPVKTLDFHGTVNVTLGLPFVRTSPDHGTALDIAGSGKADPASLISALRLAAAMAAQRAANAAQRVLA